MTEENHDTWTLAKLRRKRDQAWELAGCARQDNDRKDEELWMAKARKYAATISERIRAGDEE